MLIYLLAHAGEHHESGTEAISHQASNPKWYIVIPIVTLVFGTLLFVVLQMLASGAKSDRQDKD